MQPMPITAHTLVTETVLASPDDCFAVATDLTAYPQWVSAIASVEVLASDTEGRPSEAAFEAEAIGRRTAYVLSYDYSEVPRRFSWKQTSGDLTRRLDGAYTFEPSPDQPDATLVTYELDVELLVPLPGFVKRRAEAKILSAALDQFKDRVESS